jgi:hypothetical protein
MSATDPETVQAPVTMTPGTPRTPRTPRRPSWRRRRRAFAAVAVVAAAVVAVAVLVTQPFSSPNTPASGASGVSDNGAPTSTATVVRQDLTSQSQVSATLGYAGSYSVVGQDQGTVTSLPAVGQVVSQGQVIYEVDGAPVVLLYGQTPAYRTLAEGTSTALTGPDVAELNADLVALRYVTSAEIPSGTDTFTYWTKVGVEALQKALGVTQNGTLSMGQAVFEPTAVRVTSLSATLGAPAQPGQPVLLATSTTRQVSIALDADQKSEVAVGDKVSIVLPNNQTTPGVVSSVGTVATTPSNGGGGSSSPTITVLVNPTDPSATGNWDQAPVNVTITTGSVSDALVVPVDALLALARGGYALEVVSARGVHSLEPVSLGLFDDADGLVQVSGPGVVAGQRMVVPSL